MVIIPICFRIRLDWENILAARRDENSIFARHGRLFKNSELQTYFNQQPWYQPTYMPDDFPNELISPMGLCHRFGHRGAS